MFENITVSEIILAVQVLPGTGTAIHKNRPSHGFVLNDSESRKDYCFSDGTVLKTTENDLFYLPKGSSYEVKTITQGSCYAINFNADIEQSPFSINIRNNEKMLKIFKNAVKEWYAKTPFYQITIKKSVYEILIMLAREQQKNYLPGKKEQIIMPALEKINSDFTKPNLSIHNLAKICNVSEVYFRKIFIEKLGISPKEYIINTRINHAKDLLKSGMFSVSEVATLCGYAEPCHFSREFKKITGETPNNYKNSSVLKGASGSPASL